MKWTVGTKIGAGYALALMILVILGLFSYRNTSGFIEASRMAVHTYKVLENLETVLSNLKDAETGQRGYLITGADRYLEPYQSGKTAQAATQIAASSQQQMVGMDQVAQAMENIKQASVQNVSGTRQAEVAAQGLHELGQRLSDMVGSKAS